MVGIGKNSFIDTGRLIIAIKGKGSFLQRMDNDKKEVFHRGELVELSKDNISKELRSANPYKLIILRPIEDEKYLVALCYALPKKGRIMIETSDGPLYVRVRTFYNAHFTNLRHCMIQTDGYSRDVVEKNYREHEKYLVKQRKRRIKRQAKKADVHVQKQLEKKKVNRRAQSDFGTEYEIAVINNDTKRMREIKETVGYDPRFNGSNRKYSTGPSRGSGKRNGRVLYSNFNPRPSSGGCFTPK